LYSATLGGANTKDQNRVHRRPNRATRQADGWRIDALGAPHIGERSEAKLITDFVEKIGELHPQLITFNGHSSDLPVLRYRARVNRISAAGLQVRQYFHRYTDDALDLCDVLGSYVPGGKVKLDEVSKILGLTGKPEGVDCTKGAPRKSARSA
jgi:3'-5' exonuclease